MNTPPTELTADMVVDGRQAEALAMRPDGAGAAFVVSPVGQPGKHPVSAIWYAATDGQTPARQLTSGVAADRLPRWSPDGEDLYFLSDRVEPGVAQLYRLPFARGGEAEALTAWSPGLTGMMPLRNGRTVAVLAADEPDEDAERRKRERDDVEVFGERWPRARLRLLDLATGTLRQVAGLEDRHLIEIAPSPDGSQLAVLSWPTPELGSSLRGAEVHLVSADGERVTPLGMLSTSGNTLAWDPAGNRLYYLGHHLPDWRGGYTIHAIDLPGGAHRHFLDLPDACPIALASSPGSAPLALVAAGLDTWLGELDAVLGQLQPRLGLPGGARNLTMSDDGHSVAMIRSTGEPVAPEDVWAGPVTGPLQRVSDLRPELRDVAWGTQSRLAWSAPDGLPLDGLLVLPPGATGADGPFPLVTLVHGGPYGRYADEFQLRPQLSAQWFATAGYAVFMPNARGGVGRGHAFADLVSGAVGEADWADTDAGIDLLISQGIADPERLAIGGWSQGGFMSAWAIGQTTRFRAAIVGAGVSDWGLMIADTDLPEFEAMLAGGAGWQSPGPHRADQLSPISYLSRATTPVLILHGAADARVPVTQARYLARGLSAFGIPYELAVYPREPHRIGERAHQVDLLDRSRHWLDRWLK